MFAKLYIILVNLYMKRDFIVGVTFCFQKNLDRKKVQILGDSTSSTKSRGSAYLC